MSKLSRDTIYGDKEPKNEFESFCNSGLDNTPMDAVTASTMVQHPAINWCMGRVNFRRIREIVEQTGCVCDNDPWNMVCLTTL